MTDVFGSFLTKGLTTYKYCLQYADLKKFCQLGHCAGLYCPVASLNDPKGTLCYPKSIMLQFQICYQSHLNVSWKTKTNINFRDQTWVRHPQSAVSRALFYPISIMHKISAEYSGIL